MKELTACSRIRTATFYRPTSNASSALLSLLACLFVLFIHAPAPSLVSHAAEPPGCIAAPGGLITWLPGEGHAIDFEGNHHGGLVGGIGFVPGRVGRAFSFDGVDDSIDVWPGFNLQTFTFALWIREGDIQQEGYVDIIDTNHREGIGIVAQKVLGTQHDYSVGLGTTGGTITLQPRVWQHLVFSRGADGIVNIYLDGQTMVSKAGETIIYQGAEFLRLGRWGGGGRHWKGDIDEFDIYDRALSATEVQSLYAAGSAGKCNSCPTLLPSDLITSLPGDGHSFDLQGNHNAVYTGGPSFSPVGIVGPAFNLDGEDDAIDIGSWFDLQTFTIAMWLKEGETQGGTSDILDSNHTGSRGFVIQNYQQPMHEYSIGVTGTGLLSTFTLQPGVWQHLVLMRDNATGISRAYLDGRLIGEMAGGAINYGGAQFLRIGRWGGGGRHWKGLVDEVTVHNRSLSAGEVLALYTNRGAGACRESLLQECLPPPAGLISLWQGQGDQLDIIGERSATLASNFSYAQGLTGQAFQFSGGVIPSEARSVAPFTDITNNFTIQFWALPSGGRAITPEAVSGISGIGDQRYAMGPEHGGEDGLRAAVGVSVGTNGVSVFEHAHSYLPSPLVFNTTISGWTHVAVVYDNKEPKLYLNGILARTGLTSPRAFVYPSQFFGNVYGDYGAYVGLLDEVAIFNRALGPNEIAEIAAAGAFGMCPPVGTMDLSVLSVSSPAQANLGQPINLSVTLTNGGAGVATGPWRNALLLATDATGANAQNFGSFAFNGDLTAGSSITLMQSVILPPNAVGTRYLGVTTDSAAEVNEANENNNSKFATTPILLLAAELVAENVQSPTTSQFGQRVNVSWVTRNAGNLAATIPWDDEVFLSRSATSLAGAVSLGLSESASLNASANYSRTVSVSLPLQGDLPPGNYFLVVSVDHSKAQSESNEENNLAATPISLSFPPLPDLAVSAVVAPQIVSSGATAPFSWVITNRGSASAQGWTEVISVSNNVGGLQSLGEFYFSNLLAQGASITRTQHVNIPDILLAGQWRFFVTVDSDFEILELDEFNTGAATNLTQLPQTLSLSFLENELAENAPAAAAIVSRNGSRSAPLTVTITNANPSQLEVPASVIIPAGSASAEFAVRAVPDGIVDSSPSVIFGVQAEGYRGDSAGVTVRNIDLPILQLTMAGSAVTEGSSISGIVSRGQAANQPLTVILNSSENAQLAVPTTVTIPANELSASFQISALDDTLIESSQTNIITALSAEFQSATASVMIIDNDLPSVKLTFANRAVSEGAGPQATTATVSRQVATPRALTLDLVSSDPSVVVLPATVTIPGGQTSMSFPVATLDNQIVDGLRQVTLRVLVKDTRGNVVGEAPPETMQVHDDDGPTLKLDINRDLSAEGLNPAFSVTVTRNTATTTSLQVTLASSDPSELIVPASVAIPAGAASVTFNGSTPLDGITDGNQSVSLTASSSGFSPGVDTIVISDIDLPDLVFAGVNVATNGVTDGSLAVSFRVENRGIASSPGTFQVRALLSNDALVGNDTSLSEQTFDDVLAVNASIEQNSQFRLPNKAGRYWLLLLVDPNQQISEVLENNNTYITAVPVEVTPAYTVAVQTPITTAFAGTPVPLSGTAVRGGSGLPAADVPISIHVVLRGTKRVLSAQTDLNGNFTATFMPLLGEAGNYEIGASHPGADSAPVQDHFSLIGLRLETPSTALQVVEGSSATGLVRVVNVGEAAISGLNATVISAPANLSVQARIIGASLNALGQTDLQVAVTATGASPQTGQIRLRVNGSDGLSAEGILGVHVTALTARLISSPENLTASMVLGKQSSVEFDIVNIGGVASAPLTVSVPNAPWLRIASANPLPALVPGGTNRVTLLLTPGTDLALGPYSGSIVVDDGAAARLSLPFEVRAVSEGKGGLHVKVVDEFTYYATGAPKVANAKVLLRDAFTKQLITEATTGAGGSSLFPSLLEGHYEVEVSAEKHSPFIGTFLVRGGLTNDVEAFLSRETVSYRWTVVPTTIEDRTQITIETTFETFVPAPVVTIEPALIDLAGFTGSLTQINLIIQNHGLVAAQEFKLNFPSHPDIEFTPLITDFGTLPAQAKLNVPLTIRRKSSTAALHAMAVSLPRPCSLSAAACWTLPCGERINNYCAGITVINVAADCLQLVSPSLPSLPSSSPAWTQIPPPFIDYGGNQSGIYQILDTPEPFLPPINFEPPQLCDCEPAEYEPKCLEIPIQSSVLNAGLEAVASAFKKIPRLELDPPEADVKLQICTCCDEDGVGLALQGGAGVKFKGKVSFGPDFGFKATNSAFGFDVEAEIVLRCAADFPFEINATVEGKTGCHFKDLEMTAGASIDLPLALVCEAGVKYVLMKDGVKLGEQFDTTSVQLEYGFSGAFKYIKDSNGSRTEGEICGKGLTFRATWDVNIAGNIFSLGVTNEIVSGDCFQFGGGSALSLAIIEEANQNLQYAALRQDRLVAASNISHGQGMTQLAQLARASAAASVEDGVCAKVKLRLDQDVVMSRQAFNATLELENSSPGSSLSNITVSIFVEDETGKDVSERFGVRPPVLKGITAAGQIGASSSGAASWILVPTSEAAPTLPARYGVGGLLTYWQDGNEVTIPLFPAPITVYPDPRLNVKYFHQRDVFGDDPFTREMIEPSVPFSLAVMVQNIGGGKARDLRIVSGQPQIVENEKGLLTDFQIVSTEVSGQPKAPSLTATFGEILPGTNAIGRWLMTSPLQGLFTEYKATFEHKDSLGKTNLSLIDNVSIHEMVQLVRAPGALEDERFDFLVNDVRDSDDLPDVVYLSNGETNTVEVIRQATIDSAPSPTDLIVELTVSTSRGFTYLRVADPANGQLKLVRAVRSDGREILLGTNVWTTDRTFIGQSQRPLAENTLHLFDHDSTGRYTLYYSPLPAGDTTAPSSAVAALPETTSPQFALKWDGDDGATGSGVASFDIFVSQDDGPFTPWLQNTTLRASIYQGQQGRRYSFYSLATDNRGNRETAPGQPDATSFASRLNSAPTLNLPAKVEIDEGETLLISATATDTDLDQILLYALAPGGAPGVVIDSRTGAITWPTDEGNGPSTNQIRVIVSDSGQPPLSATGGVSVVVREVNSVPVLAPIANQKISELQTLAMALIATDVDLPSQKLSFALASGSPAGAHVDATTGVFTWTPTVLEGPSTNRLAIIVRDNGFPSLSATQTFNVIVHDSRADFTVSVGSTNILAGQRSSVPIYLVSGLDLATISLTLNLSAAGLENLAVTPVSSSVGSTTLSPAGSNRFELRFTAFPDEILENATELAWLRFDTFTNNPSALVSLEPAEIAGTRVNGENIERADGVNGRVIVVNREPVLVAEPTMPRALTLYAQPGASFNLEHVTNLNSLDWAIILRHAQLNLADRIEVGGTDSPAFYKAVRFEANPALLVPNDDYSLLLFGEPGLTYRIESTTDNDIDAAPLWSPEADVTLTNSWHLFEPTDLGSPRLFRVVNPESESHAK